jgi:archaellum component FlaG (FlaF/FlaG flagellin family)
MKQVFTLFIAAFASAAVFAQPTLQVAKPVETKVEDVLSLKQTEHDFGKIPQGKPVTYVFEVKNTGKDSLKISNVQASCGCTTPEWEQNKAIAPNGNTKITVGYNAAAEGPFNKVVTITYNGAQSKQIFIKGEVWKTPAESAPANKTLEGLKN